MLVIKNFFHPLAIACRPLCGLILCWSGTTDKSGIFCASSTWNIVSYTIKDIRVWETPKTLSLVLRWRCLEVLPTKEVYPNSGPRTCCKTIHKNEQGGPKKIKSRPWRYQLRNRRAIRVLHLITSRFHPGRYRGGLNNSFENDNFQVFGMPVFVSQPEFNIISTLEGTLRGNTEVAIR